MLGNPYPPFVPPGATSDERMIRIIDGHYNLQFTIPDVAFITVDGKAHQIHYIDETHFKIAGQYFHICQFGEQTIDLGVEVRPA